jgi:predicted anti-sigma-YlaC factor YlaD
MAGIGSYTFSVLTRRVPANPLTLIIETVNREGQSRPTYRRRGLGPSLAMYESLERFSSAANLKTGLLGYKALEGTVQTLTDALGNTYSVIVKDVTPLSDTLAEAVASTVGSGNYLLRARWEVEVVA